MMSSLKGFRAGEAPRVSDFAMYTMCGMLGGLLPYAIPPM